MLVDGWIDGWIGGGLFMIGGSGVKWKWMHGVEDIGG